MTASDEFSDWIGRTVERADLVSERLCGSFAAIFGPHLAAHPPDTAPLGVHWCLAPTIVPDDALAADGHPAKGDFLPPIPLPRRMWAGVETRFFRPLRRGEPVTRRSRIAGIMRKQGRSGALCFVTLEETYTTPAGRAVEERVSIVYRDARRTSDGVVAKEADAVSYPADIRHWSAGAGPVLLFRYSALTFNAHRIHYDRDYATGTEGYPDLVVHGPLQATLLLNFLSERRPPRRFHCQAVNPLFAGQAFRVESAEASGKELRGAIHDAGGRTTMRGGVEC